MRSRIMLVDSDITSLAALRVCIKQMVPKPDVLDPATDPERALSTAVELHPDVALVGFLLPRITGVEAAHWIMRVSPATRVILVSPYDEPWIRRKCAQLGIVGILRKGDAPARVHEMVGHALQAHSHRQHIMGHDSLVSRFWDRPLGRPQASTADQEAEHRTVLGQPPGLQSLS